MDLLHSQYQALLEISEAIASHREMEPLFRDLAPRLHRVVQFDFANLLLYEPDRKTLKSHVLETPDPAYTCAARRLSDGGTRRLGLADTKAVGRFPSSRR